MRIMRALATFFVCLSVSSYHPISFAKSAVPLSLHEAILLAVRSNPNVQISELNYLSQKFNLWVQQWEFLPQYSLQTTARVTHDGTSGSINDSTNVNIQPNVSWQSPLGTQVALAMNNTISDHYNPGVSAEILQPLMRGFGRAIVEAALQNARDSEIISRLNIENVLRHTVTEVIRAYLNVVSAQQILLIDQNALDRAERSVRQTKLFIEAGHLAGNELVTVEADKARAKAQLENDKFNLMQARYGLLSAIGVDPNSNITFKDLDLEELINQYHILSVEQTKSLTLDNDIAYQTAQIILHGSTTRHLLIAEDNTRWQLNLTANASTGGGVGGDPNSGLTSLFNGNNQSQSIALTLQIPINDQAAKQAVLNAKIALKTAELELKREKWNLETNAINVWNNVTTAKQTLQFALTAEHLQEKTYDISYQKYLHGLIDSLELQSAQLQLVQSQQTLLSARLNYLNALVMMDLLMGHTLQTWKIPVRS